MVSFVVSLVVIVMAIGVVITVRACASGRLKLNYAVGLRIGYVLRDEEAWEAGHRAAIPAVTIAAPIGVVIGIVSAIPVFGKLARVEIALAGLAVVVIGLIWGTVVANSAARASVDSRS